MRVDDSLTATGLRPRLDRLWELSAAKLDALDATWPPDRGAPVYTVDGRWTTRGWTEWTQGFAVGADLLQYDATGERRFLDRGRERTRALMAGHVSHTGVHDHGFTVVSTYGNLWRLAGEGRLDPAPGERDHWELALKVSGAVQAARWRATADGGGYVHSFNGPHSLFVDTIRSMRALALSHRLGHALLAEHDERIDLLDRLVTHAVTTARHNVYFGEGRDAYDVPGRTAHEAVFNVTDGRFRCPSSQQGYSPFTTWTRGLAWAILGFAELLEFLSTEDDVDEAAVATLYRAAQVTSDFYVDTTPADGIPYWDTGAPGLVHLPDHRDRPAEPDNPYEPVDSSAAAIAAQGLLRLGRHLGIERYWQAGLTVCATLFAEPYLSTDPDHQGLVRHSVYHRPNGWDHVPPGRAVPYGESSMWGDYHAREVALYLGRIADGGRYHTFFGGLAP
jgi:hypothetical protein